MNKGNEKAAPVELAPERRTEEKTLTEDFQPQSNITTSAEKRQEEEILRDLEISIAERVISKYCTQFNKALPELMRRRVYEKGKNDLAAYWFQPATYEYGIAKLADYLRL